MPATPWCSDSRGSSTARGSLVLSWGSCPAIAAYTTAQSSTLRVNGPIWSSEDAKAISPYRDTRP